MSLNPVDSLLSAVRAALWVPMGGPASSSPAGYQQSATRAAFGSALDYVISLRLVEQVKLALEIDAAKASLEKMLLGKTLDAQARKYMENYGVPNHHRKTLKSWYELVDDPGFRKRVIDERIRRAAQAAPQKLARAQGALREHPLVRQLEAVVDASYSLAAVRISRAVLVDMAARASEFLPDVPEKDLKDFSADRIRELWGQRSEGERKESKRD